MLEFIIAILGISLIFYVVFAGADFGAGIYELLCIITRQESRKNLVERAIGPIWEANHMWLILAVVIFFMGFPKAFASFTNVFHIPLVFVLVGIILRGTAFAFRHYDPIQDRWQKRYGVLFGISSVWTAFWQGVIVASLFSPLPTAQTGFLEFYVYPWLKPFNFAVGVFVCATYLYLAQTFFLSEATDTKEEKKEIKKDVWKSLVFVFITGGFVFLAAHHDQNDFVQNFLGNKLSTVLALITTVLLFPIVWAYQSQKNRLARVLVAFQVAFIFLAVFVKRFPALLTFDNGTSFTYFDYAAPESTLKQLFYALVFGVIIIFPFLIFLMKVFKISKTESK